MAEPSKEALEAARRACGDGGMQITTTDFVVAIAVALDRFRAAGVQGERERCTAIAEADAQDGRDDMHDPALDKGIVGSRILTGVRIAKLIRSLPHD